MIWSQVDRMTMVHPHHLGSNMVPAMLCAAWIMRLHVANEQVFDRTEPYKHTAQDTLRDSLKPHPNIAADPILLAV